LIDSATIAKILETADIVEVIRDFVSLSKKGKDYKGLCPFHEDKNPSMSVSPSRGIYKCFSCGAAGNTVKFVMDHEHLTYPEALKYLAVKYNIEFTEKEETEEDKKLKTARESLEAVVLFATNFFVKNLNNTKEGKAIGLSYLFERSFSENTITKFALGYSPDQSTSFSEAAIHAGYKTEYLINSGLSILGKNNALFDRFAGRVIFPIHSISGKVIGFGGRTLKNDKAKYVNSPESELYHKSDILYGLFFAKKEISKQDKCFLVEGYTDVISMHQSGIQNVAASSGTSLTEGQIKKIKRFTKNITVLYDGDEAGIKASIRGIDLILEQDMNVKVLPMPAGEDPDSYAKSHSSTEFLNYIEQNEQDFVVFKTTLLLKSTKNDPIKRAEVIKDVVSTISIIPDKIMRSVYIKECATLLNIKEDVIYQDIKDRILSKNKLKNPYQQNKEPEKNQPTNQPQPETNLFDISFYELEKELITYLLRFGEKTVKLRLTGKLQETTILDYIHSELKNDDLILKNQIFKELFDLISETYTKNKFIDISEFTNSTNNEISASAINIISNPFTLSKIHNLPENRDFEEDLLPDSVPKTMLVYKIKIVVLLIEQIQKELKNAEAENNFDNVMKHLNTIQLLNNKKSELAKILGRIIL